MYNLELDKAAEQIKKQKAKLVCIQLPNGLKPQATKIATKLKQKTGSEIIIWAGSCYGACDTPNLKELGVDLLLQFGHSSWPFY